MIEGTLHGGESLEEARREWRSVLEVS